MQVTGRMTNHVLLFFETNTKEHYKT